MHPVCRWCVFFSVFFSFCFKADILTPTLWLKSIQLWCNKGRFWSILENWSTPVVSVFFVSFFSFLKWNKVEKCRLSIWRHNLTVLIQECAVHIHLIKVNFFVTMRLLLLGIRNCTHCRLFFWQVFFFFYTNFNSKVFFLLFDSTIGRFQQGWTGCMEKKW